MARANTEVVGGHKTPETSARRSGPREGKHPEARTNSSDWSSSSGAQLGRLLLNGVEGGGDHGS